MKNSLITLLIILLLQTTSSGQYYYYNEKYYDKDLIWEVGGSYGAMFGLTDVGKKKYKASGRLDYKSTKPNASFYLGALYQDLIGGRLEITYGSISGTDSTGAQDRRFRSLTYRSDIREIVFITEFHPLSLKNIEYPLIISPYILAGFGWFSFNPQSYYQGRWVDLQPLRTAGQGFEEYPDRKPYKLSSACIPFGLGFKYDISPLFAARLEVLERYTFTDYLDDASAPTIDPALFYKYFSPEKAAIAEAVSNKNIGIVRGGTQTKDKYLTINLKLAMMLGRERIR
jgi:hypothetical protein